MFDKLSDAAERLATNVSRRAFLGRLGRAGLAVASVLGSMLALAGTVQASSCPPGTSVCGLDCCPTGSYCCVCNLLGGHCYPTPPHPWCKCVKV